MTAKEKFKIIGFVLATGGTVVISAIEFAQHPIAFPCVLTAAALGLGALSLKIRFEKKVKFQEQRVDEEMALADRNKSTINTRIAQALGVNIDGILATDEVRQAIDSINSGGNADSLLLASAVATRLKKGEKLNSDLVANVKNTFKVLRGG